MTVDWHSFSLPEVYAKIGSGKRGLTAKEAEKRRKKFGANELPETKIDGWPVIFFRQFRNPLIYVFAGAMAVVFLLGNYIDGFVILFVLIFNAVMGTVQEGKAQNALEKLKEFVETYVMVVRDRQKILLNDNLIVPGDIIFLAEGDKVPADCRLIEANNLRIDQSALTGESSAVQKKAEVIGKKKIEVADRYNMIFKGTGVVGGTASAVVVATGLNTEIGKISKSITGIEKAVPFQASIKKFSNFIILLVAGITAFLLVLGIFFNNRTEEMFLTAVSLAISVIPSGLPIVSTLIFAFGVMQMAKQNALVKRLQAVEALGEAEVVAVDKTGTITRNEMTIRKIYAGGRLFIVKGEGYNARGGVYFNGRKIQAKDFPEIKLSGKIAAFCSDARVSDGRVIGGDPTEAALLILGRKLGFLEFARKRHPVTMELPFDFANKYHAVWRRLDGDEFLVATGAPEMIFKISRKIWIDGREEKLNKERKNKLKKVFEEMSAEGLRVVGFGFAGKSGREHLNKTSVKGKPLTLVGFYGMEDAIRGEVPAAVKKVESAGMRTVMITGDHKLTAVAIAKQAGIYKKGDLVITGAQLSGLTKKELGKLAGSATVFARVTPSDKMKIIEAYHRRGEIVAMTGDGVNDASSLIAADLGVAMGRTGTQVAQEAADIILLDDNFGTITAAVEEGRHIRSTIKKAVLFLFSTSVGEVMSIIAAILAGWPALLVPSQIIWLNLVTDGIISAPFAWEPRDKSLLKIREKNSGNLLDGLAIQRTVLMGLVMMITSLFIFSMYFRTDLPKALTLALTSLAIMQWLNIYNVRSSSESIFKSGVLANKVMAGAIGAAVALQLSVIYWPPFQEIFRTVPLSVNEWMLAIAFSLPIVIVEELRKLLYRHG